MNLIERNGEIFVARVEVFHEQREHLFVRWAKEVVNSAAVLQTKQGGSVFGPAVGGLVGLAGKEGGKVHFLGADGVHLFAHNVFHLAVDLPAEGEPGVPTRGGTANIASADQELVARYLSIGRVVAQGTQEKVGKAMDHPLTVIQVRWGRGALGGQTATLSASFRVP